MRTQIGLLAFVLALTSVNTRSVEAQASWTRIIPGQTTETQVIEAFGPPLHAELFWPDYVAIRSSKQTRPSAFYQLKYGIGQVNNKELINDGPFGEVYQATVALRFDMVVEFAEWVYFEGHRYHSATGETRTRIAKAQIERFVGSGPFTVTKQPVLGPDAAVYEFIKGKHNMRIIYIGAGGDLVVRIH